MTDWGDVAALGLVVALVGVLGMVIHGIILLYSNLGFLGMAALLTSVGSIIIIVAALMERRRRRQ